MWGGAKVDEEEEMETGTAGKEMETGMQVKKLRE